MCWRRRRSTVGAPGATSGSTAWRSSRTASRRDARRTSTAPRPRWPATRAAGFKSSTTGRRGETATSACTPAAHRTAGSAGARGSEFRPSTPTPPFRRRSAGTPVTSRSRTWTTAGARTTAGTCGFGEARTAAGTGQGPCGYPTPLVAPPTFGRTAFSSPTATTASSRSSRTIRPSPSGGGSQLQGSWGHLVQPNPVGTRSGSVVDCHHAGGPPSSAASISGIACSLSRKWTARMPSR